MNLANKLTLARILLIPLFVFLVLAEGRVAHNFLWAALVFAVASLTDMLDGRIARKHNLVSDLGKFLDPLADKMLVISALICFVNLNMISLVAVLIVVMREFVVTGFRFFAEEKGVVIAADTLGKLKTVSQMLCIVFILAKEEILLQRNVNAGVLEVCSSGAVWIMVIFAVLSGVNYICANLDLFCEADDKGMIV